MKIIRAVIILAAVCALGAVSARTEEPKKCRIDAEEGMICDDKGKKISPGEVLKTLDQKKVDEVLTQPAKPSKIIQGVDTPKEDKDAKIKELNDQLKALQDSMTRLQDAMNEIVGTPQEIENYQNMIADALNKQDQAGTLPQTMLDVMKQAGSGSPLDFLKSIVGKLGLTGKFNDPAINPGSTSKAYQGGGYDPSLNPGAPTKFESADALKDYKGNGGNICLFLPKAEEKNIHSPERVDVNWTPGNADAQQKINHILRDTRANLTRNMDPKLLGLLADMKAELEKCHPEHGPICFEVISGYRCEHTNHNIVGGAKNSRHMHNDAVDIKVQGERIPRQELLKTAWCFQRGGVGDYNGGNARAIHVDTRGTPTTWGWTPRHKCGACGGQQSVAK